MKKLIQFLNRFHWLWLFVAAPFLLFPTPKRTLALMVVPAVWILYLLEYKIENIKYKIEEGADQPSTFNLQPSTHSVSGFPITPLNISLSILAIMMLVSLWATYSMEQSLEKIAGLMLGLGVFLAVVRESKKPGDWWWSLVVFLGGGLAWALLGFLGMEYQVRFSFLAPIITRIPILISSFPTLGTGLQHNAVGGTILWVLPLLLSISIFLLFDGNKKLKKVLLEGLRLKVEGSSSGKLAGRINNWLQQLAENQVVILALKILFWLGTLFMTGVLVLTQSRGSYLAVSLTVLLGLLIILPKRWRWILTGLLILAAAGGFLYILQSGGWETLVVDLGLSGETGLSTDTLGFRLEIWSRAIYGIQDFPFTGMGMNTFREVVHILYPLFTISPDIDIAHAHNEFLQVGLDLGLPGLIAFISIYIIAFWMLLKIWKASDGKTKAGEGLFNLNDPMLKKTLVLGLGGGLFAHLVFGMLDAITLGAKPGIFYWMLLGLISGLYNRTNSHVKGTVSDRRV